MTPELFAPYVQYGFAGFAFVLLSCLMWLTKKILGVIDRNTEVIARHDGVANMRYAAQMKVLERIDDSLDEHRDMVEDRRDKPVQGFAEDVAEVTEAVDKKDGCLAFPRGFARAVTELREKPHA